MKTTLREKIEELKPGLAIDKNSLDDEVIEQPQKFNEAGELSATAAARRDFLKEELAVIDAELSGVHRRKIEKATGKATESQVSNAVLLDPKHKAASAQYINAKETADKATALRDSYHQRRYMIQELSSLYVANYFESSSANNAQAREYKAGKARDKMAEARTKRKREE